MEDYVSQLANPITVALRESTCDVLAESLSATGAVLWAFGCAEQPRRSNAAAIQMGGEAAFVDELEQRAPRDVRLRDRPAQGRGEDRRREKRVKQPVAARPQHHRRARPLSASGRPFEWRTYQGFEHGLTPVIWEDVARSVARFR